MSKIFNIKMGFSHEISTIERLKSSLYYLENIENPSDINIKAISDLKDIISNLEICFFLKVKNLIMGNFKSIDEDIIDEYLLKFAYHAEFSVNHFMKGLEIK